MLVYYSKTGFLRYVAVSGLDFNENTGGYDEAVERFNGACVRLGNVDNSLMSAYFELFPGFFVNVGATQDGVSFDTGG